MKEVSPSRTEPPTGGRAARRRIAALTVLVLFGLAPDVAANAEAAVTDNRALRLAQATPSAPNEDRVGGDAAPPAPEPSAPLQAPAQPPGMEAGTDQPAVPTQGSRAAPPRSPEAPAPPAPGIAPGPAGEDAGADEGAAAVPPGGTPDTTGSAAPGATGPAPDMALPHDLSPWGMFLAADIVVKAVMVGLAIASVLTWAVWFVKALEIAGARARARRALRLVAGAHTLEDAVRGVEGRRGLAAEIVRAAAAEADLSAGALPEAGSEGLKERVVSRLARIEAAAARRMARGTGLLATVGATAPFVGLFGTVWGIMNAFIGISEAQTTNLAVVAPGIAEALLATALGLVAAIPAVVIYNHFARSLAGYRLLVGDLSAATLRLVSRDIDFGHLPPGAAEVPDLPREDRAAAPVPRAAE